MRHTSLETSSALGDPALVSAQSIMPPPPASLTYMLKSATLSMVSVWPPHDSGGICTPSCIGPSITSRNEGTSEGIELIQLDGGRTHAP